MNNLIIRNGKGMAYNYNGKKYMTLFQAVTAAAKKLGFSEVKLTENFYPETGKHEVFVNEAYEPYDAAYMDPEANR